MNEEENIEKQSTNNNEQSTENNENVSEPSTILTQPSTENMEVHKHPHHVMHKKKWGEYLLEFLMLFLAVFLGFVAENVREKIVNREKEKIYISGIIQNFKDDTARITGILPDQDKILRKMDSALRIPVELLQDLNKQDTFFHHFIYFYDWNVAFEQNDNTVVQLRNAGGFSIIHNQQAIDSIIKLYNYYNTVKFNRDDYLADWKTVGNLAPKFIRIPFYPSDVNDPVFYTMPHQTEFFTKYDKPLIEELYSWIRIEKGQLKLYNLQIIKYKAEAIRLIQFLKKEYHLENE